MFNLVGWEKKSWLTTGMLLKKIIEWWKIAKAKGRFRISSKDTWLTSHENDGVYIRVGQILFFWKTTNNAMGHNSWEMTWKECGKNFVLQKLTYGSKIF